VKTCCEEVAKSLVDKPAPSAAIDQQKTATSEPAASPSKRAQRLQS
jgi:hypothetical protein